MKVVKPTLLMALCSSDSDSLNYDSFIGETEGIMKYFPGKNEWNQLTRDEHNGTPGITSSY